jgi:hypothetical protein
MLDRTYDTVSVIGPSITFINCFFFFFSELHPA